MSDKYDCYKKAGKDEPTFTLRANDEMAPRVIRFWANCYLSDKDAENRLNNTALCIRVKGNYMLTHAQKEKYYDALDVAEKMEQWKEQQNAN